MVNELEAVANVVKDIRDSRAEERQCGNNNNSDKNENQRIFDQTLTFILFFECKQHN